MDSVKKPAEVGMELILLWLVSENPDWVQETKEGGQVIQTLISLPLKSKMRLHGTLRLKSFTFLDPVIEIRRNGKCIYFEDKNFEVALTQLPSRLRATVTAVGQPDSQVAPKRRAFFSQKPF